MSSNLTNRSVRIALVTIVIPVYNGEKYIVDCIDSVQRQRYQNVEIIVVDDSSTDATAPLIAALSASDKRIKIRKNLQNSGVCVSRNIGIKEAEGAYIMFLDADDMVSENSICELVKVMDDCECVLSYLHQIRMDTNGYAKSKAVATLSKSRHVQKTRNPFAELLCTNIVGSGSGFMIRNPHGIKSIVFNDNLRVESSEICGDLEFYLNMALRGSFIKVNTAFIGYRISPESMSGDSGRTLDSFISVVDIYRDEALSRGYNFVLQSRLVWSVWLFRILVSGDISKFISYYRYFMRQSRRCAIWFIFYCITTKPWRVSKRLIKRCLRIVGFGIEENKVNFRDVLSLHEG